MLDKMYQLVLIDFGNSSKNKRDTNMKRRVKEFSGDILFSSYRQMRLFETKEKDDIISVLYLLLYMMNGNKFPILESNNRISSGSELSQH